MQKVLVILRESGNYNLMRRRVWYPTGPTPHLMLFIFLLLSSSQSRTTDCVTKVSNGNEMVADAHVTGCNLGAVLLTVRDTQ